MKPVMEFKHITKQYPGVLALDDVSIQFFPGEVHSLMGENGAGKSTLIKTASGAITPDNGEIIVDGVSYKQLTPAKSRELGIGVIYQEFNLVHSLSVAENVFLGSRIGGRFTIDFKEMHARTAKLLQEFGMDLDTHTMVGELSNAQRQMVEIIKAMSQDAKILIMDEPSAAISVNDVDKMLEIVETLRSKGVAIIYVSHRMEEVFRISNRVSILRDGQYICTKAMEETSRQELINLMVGRELTESFPPRSTEIGEVVLEARNLCGNGDYDINFQLHKGEVLGFAGLVGSGRTELAKVLVGDVPIDSGELYVKGKKAHFRSTQDALNAGLGLIPEDRKNEGAFQDYRIDWNLSIMGLRRFSKHLVVNFAAADKAGAELAERLGVKTPSLAQKVCNLSGGNQQKVVLAKVLAADVDILIFDEPTRGIDVGAKQEIYHLMNQLTERGISIIMISSEMEELLGMSDRVLVMREGTFSGELKKSEFSQNRVLELAS